MHLVALNGDVNTIKTLKIVGTEASTKGAEGWTPMDLAAENCNERVEPGQDGPCDVSMAVRCQHIFRARVPSIEIAVTYVDPVVLIVMMVSYRPARMELI